MIENFILFVSIFSLIYYCILKIVTFHMAFAEFWLVLAILMIFIKIIIKKNIINIYISKIVIIILLLGLIIFLIVEGFIIYYGYKEDSSKVDYVIVLGAGLNGDKISKALRLRLDKTMEYNKVNPKTPIIVSGGMGKNETITEAEAMKKYLVNKGVDYNLIIKEDKSTNTYENFKFSKEITGNDKEVAVITNSFHMYRAKSIAEKLGFKVKCYSADTGKISALNFYVREFFAVIKYWFYS